MAGAAAARERIGFIGLGVLGSAIAPHLVADGYTVIGCDIEPTRVDALGIARADSPRMLAAESDVVILCLPTVEALHDVVSGANGLDKGVHTGQIVVEISTFPLRDKERARDRLAVAGALLLDCPVSGNRIHAQRKGLTAFGSGDRAAYDRIEPILRAFAKKRREQSGAPMELHPATRRLLQGEVARRAAKPAEAQIDPRHAVARRPVAHLTLGAIQALTGFDVGTTILAVILIEDLRVTVPAGGEQQRCAEHGPAGRHRYSLGPRAGGAGRPTSANAGHVRMEPS